jgi:8-oxo-dGTP pyrophosphatase MutT (NUDIX family)
MTDAASVGEVPLRDAATVMLVRDSADGLEVFMLRRNLQSDFVGGAYVFPGGAVDPDDRHQNLEPICTGRTDADASDQLGVEDGGLAFWVAAIRECFEEAGVLLALVAGGAVVRFDDPAVADRFAVHRKAVDNGERRLVEVCRDEGLQLAVDSIYYFSHWITPEGAPRRYDTRFFVTRAPEAQVPLHDNHEVIANLWIRPAEALARHEAGEFELIFPTVRSLVSLSRFASADELLDHAAAINDVPAILPKIVEDEGGGVRIVLPGDAEYDHVQSAVLPEGIPMNRLNVQPRTRAAAESS